jgi:rhamnogalacturonyl hydrolase YesR
MTESVMKRHAPLTDRWSDEDGLILKALGRVWRSTGADRLYQLPRKTWIASSGWRDRRVASTKNLTMRRSLPQQGILPNSQVPESLQTPI